MNPRHFPEQHLGSSITLRLENMIERLNLESLPLSMYAVNDNASNMIYQKLFTVVCAHSSN